MSGIDVTKDDSITSDTTVGGEQAKIVMYLDIDGVLNVEKAVWKLKKYRIKIYGHRTARGTFTVRVSPELGRRLGLLDVEIRWLTTWLNKADEVGRRIGLPDKLTVAGDPSVAQLEAQDSEWKRAVIKEHVEHDKRPYIWVDDEAITDDIRAWAKAQPVANLMLTTDEVWGITPRELDIIEAFVATYR